MPRAWIADGHRLPLEFGASNTNNMSQTIGLIGLTLQAVTLVTVCFFLFQLVRQQGRILLRLDGLERDNPRPSGPAGLAVGTAVEDFELPDLSGNKVSLSQFRGQHV